MTDTLELVRRITELERTVDGLVKPEAGRWVTTSALGIAQPGDITKTTNFARYIVIGNTVIMQVHFTVTGAGAPGNNIYVYNIPAAIAPVNLTGGRSAIGAGYILDSGNVFYSCTVVAVNASTFGFIGWSQTGLIGTTPSFALANNDEISLQVTYER